MDDLFVFANGYIDRNCNIKITTIMVLLVLVMIYYNNVTSNAVKNSSK